jgi:hypothetical protein
VRRLGIILGSVAVLAVVLLSVRIISRPERGTTGAVSTKFRLLGPYDKIVIDGFTISDLPQEARRVGLQEFGLPYAADPAISKHLRGAHILLNVLARFRAGYRDDEDSRTLSLREVKGTGLWRGLLSDLVAACAPLFRGKFHPRWLIKQRENSEGDPF